MAVRKIPLRQRPYLMDSATKSNSATTRQTSSEGVNEPKNSPDHAVQKTLALIRKKVLSDRVLHDQVSLAVQTTANDVQYGLEL